MLNFMLDTNICIFTIKNKPEHVRDLFNLNHDRMCISSITQMELVYGVEKSAAVERNREVLAGLLGRLTILDYDQKAAEHTGQIRAELEKKGLKIGPYDSQIAGHARSQGLVLVTNNVREFERVAGLRIEDWANPSADQQGGA